MEVWRGRVWVGERRAGRGHELSGRIHFVPASAVLLNCAARNNSSHKQTCMFIPVRGLGHKRLQTQLCEAIPQQLVRLQQEHNHAQANVSMNRVLLFPAQHTSALALALKSLTWSGVSCQPTSKRSDASTTITQRSVHTQWSIVTFTRPERIPDRQNTPASPSSPYS